MGGAPNSCEVCAAASSTIDCLNCEVRSHSFLQAVPSRRRVNPCSTWKRLVVLLLMLALAAGDATSLQPAADPDTMSLFSLANASFHAL